MRAYETTINAQIDLRYIPTILSSSGGGSFIIDNTIAEALEPPTKLKPQEFTTAAMETTMEGIYTVIRTWIRELRGLSSQN